MQISGAIDFFSKIMSPDMTAGARNSGFSPTQAVAERMRTGGDSLSLSDAGRKLSLSVNKEPASVEEENRKTDMADPVLELLDKEMSNMKSILEQMHELAIAASDESITDIDRVNMQIELENLRNELSAIPKNMLSQEQGGKLLTPNDLSLEFEYTNALYVGDGSSMLERMKERITNGKDWDVREAWMPTGFGANDGKWVVVDDKNVLTQTVGEEDKFKTVETDQKVPTVLERLGQETPIILMDAASAAEGAKNLERRINSVQKWRDSIEDLKVSQESQSVDKAAISSKDMLIQAINHFGNDPLFFGSSLTIADAPRYFSYTDGVYNGIKMEQAVEINMSDSTNLWEKDAELLLAEYAYAEYAYDAILNPELGQLFNLVA